MERERQLFEHSFWFRVITRMKTKHLLAILRKQRPLNAASIVWFLNRGDIKDENLMTKKIEPFEERRDILYNRSKKNSDIPSRDSSRRRSELRFGNRKRHWKRRGKRVSLSGEDEYHRSTISHRSSNLAVGSWRVWSKAHFAMCWRISESRRVSWVGRGQNIPASEKEPVTGEQNERELRRAKRLEQGNTGSGQGFFRRLHWLRQKARRRGQDGSFEPVSRPGMPVRCWVGPVRRVDWSRRWGREENRGWRVKWDFSF